MRDEAFNITKSPKHDGYQRGLSLMACKCFDKKTSGTRANKFAGCGVKNENMSKKEMASELHKLIIRKFKKRKVYSSFIDNI